MRLALSLLAAAFLALPAVAAPIDYFRADGVSYREDVPTPEERLGHELGDKPVRHDVMVAYLKELADLSPRITHKVLGYSHEGRPILGFVVTSEENHENIDAIRAAHLNRLDPENADADGPAVVWLNYGVHGAESSGMDAAIPVLYHLAAAEGASVDRTLDETVVLMVAIFNPDGHSRRVNHVYQHLPATEVTNPDHEAHRLWTEARVNHYWFDLNRDWLLLTQPESRAWIGFWHEWKPNVSADFHEMGSDSTYYFHPGEPKRRNGLIPDAVPRFLAGLAEGHRAALDKRDELYFSEEGFDNFYIGKGSTYPSVNGSVGILFEAGAARGGAIEGSVGVRRYEENIRLHFDTSLSTIEGARKARSELLAYQRSFFVASDADGS
ncbi:MAG: M14 family zinc carboxypeptidase, partial [Pseudomonadota bacterium]